MCCAMLRCAALHCVRRVEGFSCTTFLHAARRSAYVLRWWLHAMQRTCCQAQAVLSELDVVPRHLQQSTQALGCLRNV